MTRRIFITGTGTDVGKTVITRGIARALLKKKVNFKALKPVESGVPEVNGALQPHDGTALLRASQAKGRVEEVCRYMFRAAVSPHLAARMENAIIDPREMRQFIDTAAASCDVLIVEGAGGLSVPLNDEILYGDFIAGGPYELLIVAPDILGTINNTLLTIEAARHRQIPVAGVILNHGSNLSESLKNAEAIAHFGKVPILGTFPRMTSINDDDALADAAETHLDLKLFYKG
jgi:dethiobiotin synthetase